MNETLNDSFYDLSPQVQLNDQQVAYLEKRFATFGNAVVEARKLKDMPNGRYPINYSSDFITTKLSSQAAYVISEFLQWDAANRAQASDAGGALESCLALQNAANSVGDEPLLFSRGPRFSCNMASSAALERTLAQIHFTQVSEPFLKNIQAALTRELPDLTVVWLRGERAGMHQFIQAVAEGRVTTPLFSNPLEEALVNVPSYRSRQHAALLRFYTKLVEAARLPPAEGDERFAILEKAASEESFFVRAWLPSMLRYRQSEHRNQANVRCALAAVAAERFRIAKNRWPESLKVLVSAGYLDVVPMDPFDGKPLRFKRTNDGVAIYSVGQNKIDDGGAIHTTHANQRTDPPDQGFQLWDVASRRQPPNPPVTEDDGGEQ